MRISRLRMNIINTTLVSVISFIAVLAADSSAFQNEPEGFRGIKWGTDISVLDNMEEAGAANVPGVGAIKYYSRKDEILSIDRVNVDSIKYGFLNDKFANVAITTISYVRWEALRDICFKNFGEGRKINRYYYVWDGEAAEIELELHIDSLEGTLFISSKEAYKKLKGDENKKLKGF